MIDNTRLIEMITHGDGGLEVRVDIRQFKVNCVYLDTTSRNLACAGELSNCPIDYENCLIISRGSQINVTSYGV
jgi:hypothetical protein